MGRKKRTPTTAGTKPPAAATSPEVGETTVDDEGTVEDTDDGEGGVEDPEEPEDPEETEGDDDPEEPEGDNDGDGDDENPKSVEPQTTADTSVVGPKAKPRKIASERTLPKRDLGGIYKLACRMRVDGKVKKPGELVTLTDEEARTYLKAGPVIEPQD